MIQGNRLKLAVNQPKGTKNESNSQLVVSVISQ